MHINDNLDNQNISLSKALQSKSLLFSVFFNISLSVMFVLAGRSCEVGSLFLLCLTLGLVPGLDSLGTPVYEDLVRLVVKETDEDTGHVVTAQSAHLTVRREAPEGRHCQC